MSDPRTTWGLVRYFLYLGSLGFGGPVALIGYMQRDLVERRGWLGRDEFLDLCRRFPEIEVEVRKVIARRHE